MPIGTITRPRPLPCGGMWKVAATDGTVVLERHYIPLESVARAALLQHARERFAIESMKADNADAIERARAHVETCRIAEPRPALPRFAVYAFNAELLCASCGAEAQGNNSDMANSTDSDHYPQGPYGDGGGESDCPQHCGTCGLFLDNPLTDDGRAYVRAALRDGTGNPATLATWRDAYGPELDMCEHRQDAPCYLDPESVADSTYRAAPMWDGTSRPGKVPTPHMLKLGSRWHRVYAMAFGNSPTLYVVKGGADRLLRPETESLLTSH